MKKVNTKWVVLIIVVVILLAGFIIFFNSGTAIMSLKFEYASFIEENGIVTEVRFHAPANFNVIELNSESEISCDENGNEQQITVYKGNVKKSFFASEPTIPVDRSSVYKFIFTDKTVTIVNGVLTGSLHQ